MTNRPSWQPLRVGDKAHNRYRTSWLWLHTEPDHRMLQFGRFAVALWREWRWPWFQMWRPAWFQGKVRYVTMGAGPLAFYAGDPWPRGGKW